MNRACPKVAQRIIPLIAVVFIGIISVDLSAYGFTGGAPVYGYKVVNVYPHDPNAFTQGLFFDNGFLYEGTGLYGRSELRKIDLTTGRVLKEYRLPALYFGEGITLWNDNIIQLTWHEKKGFVYEKGSLRLVREFPVPSEGWGLTHDDKRLIMSDGSSYLYFLDPQTFKRTGKIEVRDNGVPVTNLNELEYVGGKIYSNVWLTDRVAIISLGTGAVEAWIDLSGLKRDYGLPSGTDVLNGIAYDKEKNRLFVTGKLWPKLFEIKIVPAK